MASFLRKLVSQNKNRFKMDGYDLDLTYLTDQVICMGLPAQGSEALYRNPIDSVVRFLDSHHAGHYKVFNLCNERSYDISKFGDACASFPFDDHGAPALSLVVAFCMSAKSWLLQSMENVVAVHCKAGKGRTGVMACCLVLHLGYQRTATAAIQFYNGRRTKDGRGLTVPSQRRVVRYYERLLQGASFDGLKRTISEIRVAGLPVRYSRLQVKIVQHGAAKPSAPFLVMIDIDPRLAAGAPHAVYCELPVDSDLRVEVADDHGHELCRAWIHPALEPSEAVFAYHHDKLRSELDTTHTSDKGALADGFRITLCFLDTEATRASVETSRRLSASVSMRPDPSAPLPPPSPLHVPSSTREPTPAAGPESGGGLERVALAYADNYAEAADEQADEASSPGARDRATSSARERVGSLSSDLRNSTSM